MVNSESCKHEDWVSNSRSYMLAWGLPGIILVTGIFLEPLTRTVMWAGALLWKAIACLANAARCGRTHCYFTGPYFFVLAIVTVLHGLQIVWLGVYGWLWLGLAIVAGGGALWYLTEKAWGKFSRGRPMSRYLSDNITYDNSGKYSSKIHLILSPLLAERGSRVNTPMM